MQGIEDDLFNFGKKIESIVPAIVNLTAKGADFSKTAFEAIKQGNLGLELEKGMEKLGQTKLG